MGTKAIKRQTAFRLKEKAKKANRSLSNYVECILMDSVYNEPNETTIAAMNEAENEELEVLDLTDFEKYVASL